MKRTDGFVLFTTILMLAMLTLLVLSLMQAMLLYVKAGHELTVRHQTFYQLETAAKVIRLSQLANQEAPCTVEEKPFHSIIESLSKRGCEKVIHSHVYLYLFEDLGVFPCLHMVRKHHTFSSHHWRLTVIPKKQPSEVLQLRITSKANLQACDGNVVDIRQGMVSWRYLTTT